MAGYLLASLVIFLQLGVAAFGTEGVPLPAFCKGDRGDHLPLPGTVDVPTDCEIKEARRVFFHKDKHCKKFGLCARHADYLDREGGLNINYFQSISECEQACTNVVECVGEPLEIDNGYPVVVTEEGRHRRLEAGESVGYGTRVGFKCHKGYQLMKCNLSCYWNESLSDTELDTNCINCSGPITPLEITESYRFCQLNATWSNVQPYCAVQCPKPRSLPDNVSLSPVKDYYNIGEKLQLDCMDGLKGSTVWTCQHQGTWEGQVPTCSPSCAPPPVDNAYPPEETVADTFSYRCYEGYYLLEGNSTLHCNKGTLEGEPPICTRVVIRTEDGALPRKNGNYFFDPESGSDDRRLTCVLEGLEESDYSVVWTVPRKPNGEKPPAVEVMRNTLVFTTAYPEQSGDYECHIHNVSGLSGSVTVEVNRTEGVDPPNVTIFQPNGTVTRSSGEYLQIYAVISGTLPININWQHNGSNLVAHSTDKYIMTSNSHPNSILCTLKIVMLGEEDKGVYRIEASNRGGTLVSSEMVELKLSEGEQQPQSQHRFRRSAAFCSDPQKVVLVGVVRRTGRTQSGLQTIRLRVDRVLRGDARGITRTVEVHILSGANTSQLYRGQKIILSALPHKGRILYMWNTPIETYSETLTNEIVDC